MYQAHKIIVIGGNAAGPSAAAKAKRVNPDAEVILFEAGEFISTGTCELPYLFSGEIKDYNEIVFFTPESFEKNKGVKVYNNHYVKEIDRKHKIVFVLNRRTNSVTEFEYDKLILTTGSKPNQLYNLPFSLENVFSYKSVENYLDVKKYIDSNEVNNILVVGSGYIGLEIADSLNRANFNITLLEQAELPMPSAEVEVQHIVYDLITKSNIIFLSTDDQTKFITKDNKFTQLKHEGRFIDFDLAIVAAGIQPNNEIAKSAGLKLGDFDGLKLDNRLRTSDPNIYAAGDNTEIINFITKRNDYLPLATYAHQYGHIAGENAAGGNQIAKPVILNSAFQCCGKFISLVGLSFDRAKEHFVNTCSVTAVANNKVKVMPDSQSVFGKLIFDKNTKLILGSSFVGSEEISGYADIISTMIYNRIPVQNLAEINFNYTPPLSPFINLLSILGRKAKENF